MLTLKKPNIKKLIGSFEILSKWFFSKKLLLKILKNFGFADDLSKT